MILQTCPRWAETKLKLFEARIKTQFVNINAYAIVLCRRIDECERINPNCGFLSGISLFGILHLGPTLSTYLLPSSCSENLQIIRLLEQNKYCLFSCFQNIKSVGLTLPVCSLFSIGPWWIQSEYLIALLQWYCLFVKNPNTDSPSRLLLWDVICWSDLGN